LKNNEKNFSRNLDMLEMGNCVPHNILASFVFFKCNYMNDVFSGVYYGPNPHHHPCLIHALAFILSALAYWVLTGSRSLLPLHYPVSLL
jgi:hypothetical protein